MQISKQDLERIHQKFVSDPDWRIVEQLLEQFVEPLKYVDNIDTKGKTADEVFALVEGRKLAIESLNNFLSEIRLLKTAVTKSTEKTSFK
jgi:hypothetical protein